MVIEGFMEVFPPVALIVGLSAPVVAYFFLRPAEGITWRDIIIYSAAMLATGGSTNAAIDILKEFGATNIVFLLRRSAEASCGGRDSAATTAHEGSQERRADRDDR